MKSTRGVTVCGLVVLIMLGPLAPWALAQQVGQPEAASELSREYGPRSRPTDAYDVAAAVATPFKIGGNVITCVLGGALGTALFFASLGSAYKASARVFEEGCAQKWVLSGSDLRPTGPPGFYELRRDGYTGDRR